MSDSLRWEAKEVVRDLYQRPHLLTRVTLTGIFFPQRALEPFVAVGKTRSRFVEIAGDGLRAHAYFDEPLPHPGPVVFGYGREILHRWSRPFHPDTVERLDRSSLPENVRLPGQTNDP